MGLLDVAWKELSNEPNITNFHYELREILILKMVVLFSKHISPHKCNVYHLSKKKAFVNVHVGSASLSRAFLQTWRFIWAYGFINLDGISIQIF